MNIFKNWIKVLISFAKSLVVKALALSKEPVPVLTLLVLSILTYNLYLKPRFEMPAIEEDVVTLDLKYLTDNFRLYANKAIERAGKQFLQGVNLTNEDSKIKAGAAQILNENDLIFQKGVQGSNQTWDFKSEEASITNVDNKKIFTLFGDVDTFNREKNLRVKSKSFRLVEGKLSLKGDVEITLKDIILSAQQAFYEDPNLSLEDNVMVKKKQNDKDLKLQTQALEFDSETEKGQSKTNFRMNVDDYLVEGNSFTIDKENFITTNPIEIKKNSEVMKALNASYLENELTLQDVDGYIDGRYVKCNRLKVKDNKFFLKGNVIIREKERELNCQELTLDNGIIVAKGDVLLVVKQNTIMTQEITYDQNSGEVKTNTVVINDKDSTLTMDSLEYNELSEAGYAVNFSSKGKRDISSKNLRFNIKLEQYLFIGDVKINANDYELNGDEFKIDKNIYTFPKVTIKADSTTIEMSDVLYDSQSKELKTECEIIGKNENYHFRTKGLTYNEESKQGLLQDKFILKDDKDFILESPTVAIEENIFIFNSPSGSKGEMKYRANKATLDKVFSMVGDVTITDKEMTIFSQQVDFDLSAKILTFVQETDVKRDDFLIIAKTGEIYIDQDIMKAKDVVLMRDNGDVIKASFAEFNQKMKVVNCSGVFGEVSKGTRFNANFGRLFFSKKNEDTFTRAELNGDVLFKVQDLTIQSQFLEYDNGINQNIELVYAKDELKINVMDDRASITAGYAYYDLEKELGRLKQNVVITAKDSSVGIVNATATEALHDHKNNKIALFNNVVAKGSKSDLEVRGDDVELDLNTFVITSDGKAGFIYDFDKTTEQDEKILSEILSEYKEDIIGLENIT